jgi:hypothetical protein
MDYNIHLITCIKKNQIICILFTIIKNEQYLKFNC